MKFNPKDRTGEDNEDNVSEVANTATPVVHEVTLKRDVINNDVLYKAGSKIKVDAITIRFLKDNDLA